MAKSFVIQRDVSTVERWLKKHSDLSHVRVRKCGNLLILESGSKEAPIPHARLRRTEIGTWALEMPHRSRWEPTPYQDREQEPLLDLLHSSFGWMLMPIA